jgi:hypothetical protein
MIGRIRAAKARMSGARPEQNRKALIRKLAPTKDRNVERPV